ncbi:MAG: lysophospholipid acyltransferase family protein [Candidatus Woesearchaeota archaeon]|jgi:1-acyl-sn-glycerol-3-phosphate acyltransferase|nr:lysophospholipid acyltransferase family protein [Candidatus Woesearchaeota archaeon]|tara:strand:+ start:4210 stop:4866 length:657 start_codon:yes stop_codon:yes gene_type:complete
MNRIPPIAPIAKYIIPPICNIWIDKVTGLHNLSKDGPFIIAPNHSSYIEHIMISCTVVPHLNKKLLFVAKKEHFEDMTQKLWHRLWNNYITYVQIDRSKGEEALKTTLSYLKKGAIIVVYPEGTRTLTGKLQSAKTGVARLALWAKVPVVPLGIIGTFQILPKGKKIPRMKKATLNFGKPLYFDKYYNKKITKKLLRKITNNIMKEIAKLSNQKYEFL